MTIIDAHPATDAAPAGTATGWQAVTLTEYDGDPGQGRAEYVANDARTGDYAGEVWRDTRGRWHAWRRGAPAGRGNAAGLRTRGAALAAVQWLDAVPAERVRAGAALILADGTAVTVAGTWAGNATERRAVELHATGRRVALAAPAPVEPMRAQVESTRRRGRRVIAYLYRPAAGARVWLAPPCWHCSTDAGRACAPHCPTSAR